MTFHAKAACFSARPVPLATFRQHLLCSVCVTLFLAGPGFAQSVDPQPVNNPPLTDQQNGDKTVGTGETLVINTGETAGDIIINGEKAWVTNKEGDDVVDGIGGIANVYGQMGNGTVNKGGLLNVNVLGAAKDVTVNDGGFAQIFDRGRISGTSTVNTRGLLTVNAGGTASDIIVNGEKAWIVDDKNNDVVDGIGGSAAVFGQTANGTVNKGGSLNINAGGTAKDITVNDGGFVQFFDQGRISGTSTVNTGGVLSVVAGGIASDIVINGEKAWTSGEKGIGGIASVFGQMANGTVNKGGYLGVAPGGTAKDITVNDGGYAQILDHGRITGTSTVNTRGLLMVKAGGAASDIIVNGEKAWVVNKEGNNIVDGIGGLAKVSGQMGNGTINKGGQLNVDAGGTAKDITVNDGGFVQIFDQGRISGMSTVNTGGVLGVNVGGIASDIVVNGDKGIGGLAAVSGQMANGTVNKSGLLTVTTGGVAKDVTVNDGGYAQILDHGRISGTSTVNTGGVLSVVAGGIASDIVINGEKAWTSGEKGIGGLANISGQIGNGTINKGGQLNVAAGGTAKDITVNDGGFVQFFDQGRISGTSTVNTGGVLSVVAGGIASDIVINGEKAWTSGEKGIGGIASVFGQMANGTVNKGGYLGVAPGGTAKDITVNDGGYAQILDHGRITGTSTVNTRGLLMVKAGGAASDIIVNGEKAWVVDEKGNDVVGGIADVYGQMRNGIVNKGGRLNVDAGGTAKDITVNGGELWMREGGKATGNIIVNNGGYAQIFDQGHISGTSTVNTGGILKITAGGTTGDIIVSDNDSVTECTVDCSYAIIDGTSGNVTVNNNGALNGTGKIGNLAVHAGGHVITGTGDNLFGALTATGDATFDKGSIFKVQVANDGSRTNQLAVKGQANLSGGTVKLRSEDILKTAADGSKIFKEPNKEQIERLFQKNFLILTAEKGVTGRFDAVSPQLDYNYITPSLTYTDKTVSVGVGLKDAAQIQDIVLVGATTKNQKSVGSAIKSLSLGNPLLRTVLFSHKGEVLDYDALSGETHASLEGVLMQDAGLARDAVSDRVRAAFGGVAAKPVPTVALAYGPDAKKGAAGDAFVPLLPAVPTTALWGEAYGSRSHADGDGNASAYSRNTGGFVTGFDGVIADTWRFGLLAGYGNTSVHTDRGRASADSYQVGVYGGTRIDALTLSLGTSLAHHEIDTRRKVVFGGINDSNTADYAANTVQLFGEAAYRIDTAYAALEPFAAAAYTHLKTAGFTETGGTTALSGSSGTTDLTTTTLGLRASHRFAVSEATVLTAHGMAGWRHAFGDTTPEASLAFASGGQAFAVSGSPIASDTALVEAGLDFGIGKATMLGISYTGQFSQQTRDNAVKANVTTRF